MSCSGECSIVTLGTRHRCSAIADAAKQRRRRTNPPFRTTSRAIIAIIGLSIMFRRRQDLTQNWVVPMSPGCARSKCVYSQPFSYILRRSYTRSSIVSGGQMVEFDAPGLVGVSTAAHLRSCGVNFRICSSPINRRRTQMPAGIRKSERFASSLADPAAHHSLQQSCRQAARGVFCNILDGLGSTDFCCGGGLK
jgi:hypothetical protein